MRIIVSMTSWTKRIGNVKTVLESLLNQEMKADLIELNLSLEEFPNKEKGLPEDLVELIRNNECIEINWVEGNTRLFKKFIPVLKKFYGEDYLLLTVDDDWVYGKEYIRIMVEYQKKYKSDSFALSNGFVVGNRMIYKSSCFEPDFWEKLTDEMIEAGNDDIYIEHYLPSKRRIRCHFRPNDVEKIIIPFNPIEPNSKNIVTGLYSADEINKNRVAANKIKFN